MKILRDAETLKCIIIFALVIFAWSSSWPVNKIALEYIPPLWFSTGRCAIGFLAISIIYILTQKKFYWPKKADLFLIITLGLLQLGFFQILINVGLTQVSAGRTAILVYTTPIWIFPITVFFLHEKINLAKMLGFILGVGGIAILFEPHTFPWHDKNLILHNFYLLLAAFCWAIAIVIARHSTWQARPFDLIIWQLFLATIFCLVFTLPLEPWHSIQWTWAAILSFLYTGLATMAFGYWGMLVISRRFSSLTTSLGLLLVPVLGALFSVWWLHEPLTQTLLMSLAAIVVGIFFVIIGENRQSKSETTSHE